MFDLIKKTLLAGVGALANLLGGALIIRDAAGHLVGYGRVGWVATGAFLLTLVLAHRLRAAAPHAATNAPFRGPME